MKKYILILVFLIGCGSTDLLMRLQLDMTKDEVIGSIGKPDVARGSMRNKYDQIVEVWEYYLVKPGESAINNTTTTYWLYFCNKKLVQWGQAGDWNREADRIYEMRFR